MISRRTHGMLDYSVSALLVLLPFIMGWDRTSPEAMVPIILGLGGIIYSLLTDYEFGVVRVLPFSMHLALDFLSGLFLAASPWLLGFADRVYGPHLLFGLFEMGAAMMTQRAPVARTTTAI